MFGESAFEVRHDFVPQPHIGERAANHDFVITAPRAVGIEVRGLDAMVDEILSGGAVLLNGTRRRDVIGSDAIAKHRQHTGATNVLDRARLNSHFIEIRCEAYVSGILLPRVSFSLGHR